MAPFAAFALICGLLGFAGANIIEHMTARLIEQDVETKARRWSDYLVSNITDLDAVAEGAPPSPHLLDLFDQARQVGGIYQFSIYRADGRLRLKSDEPWRTADDVAWLGSSHPYFQPAFARKVGGMVSHKRQVIGDPELFVEVLAPIVKRGALAGWIVMRMDETARQALFFDAGAKLSLGVGAAVALGPLFGFWFRTRQKRQAERRLDFVVHHDTLTGLRNRAAWLAEIAGLLAERARAGACLAVFHIEIGGIRGAGDVIGPAASDHAVIATANRIEACCPASLLIARLDGGRFGLALADCGDAVATAQLAQRIIAALAPPIDWQGESILVHANLGIAVAPHDGEDAGRLMMAAESALKAAQEAGRNQYRFFDPAAQKSLHDRRESERNVAGAVAKNRLEVHYQPVIDLRSGKVTGFEALARMRDHTGGFISPAEFIPVAEQIGAIDQIGQWCLEEACRMAANWPSDVTLAVNLSPIQFNTGTLIPGLRHALDRARFPAYRLELEVTEGLLLGDGDHVRAQLAALQEMGMQLVLDDFGTGYSSLNYLWRFPFSKFKIDQSFIRALEQTPSAHGILRTMVSLGRSLGLPITAEGVETVDQMRLLQRLRCDLAQGYLFGRPVPAAEVAAILMRDFAAQTNLRAKRLSAPAPAGRRLRSA